MYGDFNADQGHFGSLAEGRWLTEGRHAVLRAVGVHLFWWMLLAQLAPSLPQGLGSEHDEIGKPCEGLPALGMPAEPADSINKGGLTLGVPRGHGARTGRATRTRNASKLPRGGDVFVKSSGDGETSSRLLGISLRRELEAGRSARGDTPKPLTLPPLPPQVPKMFGQRRMDMG